MIQTVTIMNKKCKNYDICHRFGLVGEQLCPVNCKDYNEQIYKNRH